MSIRKKIEYGINYLEFSATDASISLFFRPGDSCKEADELISDYLHKPVKALKKASEDAYNKEELDLEHKMELFTKSVAACSVANAIKSGIGPILGPALGPATSNIITKPLNKIKKECIEELIKGKK